MDQEVAVAPARANFESLAVPAAVLAEISATPQTAQIYPIDKEVVRFAGKVLKVDTLVFRPGCKLLLMDNKQPWLAVVARTIKFAAPDEVGEIGVLPDDSVVPPLEHPWPVPPAASGQKGGKGQNGTPGADGANGLRGVNGADGPTVPALYLLADSIEAQPGGGIPDFISLRIWSRGRYGAEGGTGQDGQSGGTGGDGGNGVWSNSRFQCTTTPRSGGPGGAAGTAGDGGNGGRGGDGMLVHFGGSNQALNLFEYAKVNNFAGEPGLPGRAGLNGSPGAGGDRGSRPGQCTGGSRGPNGAPALGVPKDGQVGASGNRGAILKQVLSVAGLF